MRVSFLRVDINKVVFTVNWEENSTNAHFSPMSALG